jgi:predicted MFS family arabinose efflux permease
MFERFGNRPWIVVGLSLLTISFLCYIPVSVSWQLMIPAAIAGCAHALLFPSVMAAGTSVFPRKYLGVATSMILAMFDFGTFISAPLAGMFLRLMKHEGGNGYECMFGVSAAMFGVTTVLFYLSPAARRSPEQNLSVPPDSSSVE